MQSYTPVVLLQAMAMEGIMSVHARDKGHFLQPFLGPLLFLPVTAAAAVAAVDDRHNGQRANAPNAILRVALR